MQSNGHCARHSRTNYCDEETEDAGNMEAFLSLLQGEMELLVVEISHRNKGATQHGFDPVIT